MSKLIRNNTQTLNDPFALLTKLEEAFSTNKNTFWKGTMSPPCDIVEEDSSFSIYLDIPGMNEEDIDIKFENSTLIVKGERKPEKFDKSRFGRSERIFGKFVRTWTVPTNLDAEQISAEYSRGVLKITLQKKELPEPTSVKIKLIDK